MPIVIKNLETGEVTQPGKKKKNKGPLPKSKPPRHARPNHPMNTEKTTGLKEDAEYKSIGGMVYKGR
jgi:hypothetical protein